MFFTVMINLTSSPTFAILLLSRSFSNTHVLVTSRSASAPVLTSAISLASTSDPVGGVAVTTTVLRTNLVSATSDVITYVAV